MTRLASIVAIAALAAGGSTRAHELGAARVTILFTLDGRYRIDAAVFPEHLPPQVAGEPSDRSAIRANVIEAARILFDGVAMRPLVTAPGARSDDATLSSGGATQVLVRFEGPIPGGARSFAWRLELPLGIYLVGTRDDGADTIAWQWIQGESASEPVTLLHAPPPPSRMQVARRFVALGFTRVFTSGFELGWLALGLFLLSPRPRAVLTQVVAFAAAHSIALAFAVYGGVTLGPRIAAPLIALSIAYIAIDNFAADRVNSSRLAVVSAFGLVYGAGCAGVLRETGLRRADFSTALVSFNAGSTAGQVVVVGLAFLAVGAWFGRKPWYRARLSVPASALIAIVGAIWTIFRS